MTARGAGVWERTNPLLSRPVAIVGNEGTVRMPAESPPLGINDVGIRNPKKRKRATTSDGGCEEKRSRRKKSQRLDGQEQPQVSIVGLGLIRERAVTLHSL